MIIKGSHSGVTPLSAGENPASEDQSPVILAAVDNPNRSFSYLTLDPAAPAANPDAFLPKDDPVTVIQALKALGSAMIEDSDTEAGNSRIPPVYTYWGQFIDHDITAGTDRSSNNGFNMLSMDILDEDFMPQNPQAVVGNNGIFNLRLPELDLDSVYGGGPLDFPTEQEGIFTGDKLRLNVGKNHVLSPDLTPNPQLDSGSDPMRDLPRRNNRRAKIGDDRNDENTIVAQFHTAFLRFHNAVVDFLENRVGTPPSFDEASQTVRWQYQWLVVNDYLRTICKDGIVDQILFSGNGFFNNSNRFMPLEFSVAAFRFGHSMVRAAYDFNKNFGRADNPQLERASFDLLFRFTGLKGDLGAQLIGQDISNLPNNWIIDWARFTDKDSPHADRFTRKIDTNLAMPLTQIPADTDANTGAQPAFNQLSALEKHLAQRNLLRSYLLSVPTGQFVADQLGIPKLTAEELVPQDKPNVKAALENNSGLLQEKTPLWYYILREAEVQTGGNTLGELGSRIVAGTLIGLLKADPNSYLNNDWDPSKGVKLADDQPIVRIMDLFRFAGVA